MKINHKIKRGKVRRCLDYDNSNPMPNVGAVKSMSTSINLSFIKQCFPYSMRKVLLILKISCSLKLKSMLFPTSLVAGHYKRLESKIYLQVIVHELVHLDVNTT